MRFVYSLVRFVPDPARGEFVNVGAIVGSEESSEWQVRQVENPVRARTLDESNSLDAVWTFLDRVGSSIDEYEAAVDQLFDPSVELSEVWLDRLHADHRNLVQLSQPAPMVADSAEEALDRVFELAILDPAQRRYVFQKKHTALAAVRKAYKERSIRKGEDFIERVQITTQHHRGRVDFAVVNGRALQLTHTWSFQIPDQAGLADQVRAWGWIMHDAQRGGGVAIGRQGREYAVAEDVDIEVVYIPPLDHHPLDAYEGALDVFDTLGVRYTTADEAGLVADKADELLLTAGKGRLDVREK